MYRSNTIRDKTEELLLEKKKKGKEVVISLDDLERYFRDVYPKSFDDPRGSITKMMNRHTPGGQHKGDGYNAVDIFYKEEENGKIYYGLLSDKDLKKWNDFT